MLIWIGVLDRHLFELLHFLLFIREGGPSPLLDLDGERKHLVEK